VWLVIEDEIALAGLAERSGWPMPASPWMLQVMARRDCSRALEFPLDFAIVDLGLPKVFRASK